MPTPQPSSGQSGRAAEAEPHSEQRLGFVLDSAGIGCWSYDVHNNVITGSLKHDQIFGHDQRLPGWDYERLLSHIHPDDRDPVHQTYQNALKTGELAAEFRIVWPDHTVHWIWTHGHTHGDAAGRSHFITGIVMDITERKYTEQRVRFVANACRILCDSLHSDTTLQDIAQLAVSSIASFCFFDVLNEADGQVERVASAHSEFFQKEFSDQSWIDLTDHPVSKALRAGKTEFIPLVTDEWMRETARTKAHYDSMRGLDLRSLIVAPIAAREHLLGTFTLCRAGPDSQAYTAADVAVAEDLGRRAGLAIDNTRMLHSLSESEQRFRAVAEDAPAMIWTSGRDGSCDYFNKAWLGFTGRTLEQELGNGWAESVHPEDLEQCLQDYMACFESQRPFTLEYRLRRDDGQYRWVLDAGIPRFSSRGQFTGYIGYGIDITDRREAEERLLESAKLESLGVLAGGIAHDFNNLLVGMIGNSSLGIDMLSPSHPVQPLLEDVLHAGEKAAELTRQMLAYAGKGRFISKTVDLSQLVEEIIPLVQASIPKKVQLRLDLARGLSPIDADPSQIQQIIMNLVINAAEACDPEADGVVAVSTALREVDDRCDWAVSGAERLPPGTYVCLKVEDNGRGMDEQTKAKVFDPFFTTKFTGRGLGLSAVLGIVRTHKGAIRLQSEPGAGSTFEVVFARMPEESVRAEQTQHRDLARQFGTILVVDDEEIVRRTVSAALQRRGYTVIVAENGQEAIEKFRTAADDLILVLLDVTMPVMGGEETLRHLRAIRANVNVIVSSGYDEVDVGCKFTGHGVSFIQKPYTFAELTEKIEAAIQAGQ